jgi:predicted GIY-YIG superfamily endonuclease
MGQTLLFPDPKPLDQRLGKRFFWRTPRRPGVYLMKDANDKVIYVGKAKDLKQRLNNYRVANPDRMPRRHLRMVREVARIEFQFCANEAAALKHESRLLRSIKPRYNRAGVWPGKTKFIAWRFTEQRLELGVVETPEPDWRRFGPLNGSAHGVYCSLARLLWLAVNPGRTCSELPPGWARGDLAPRVTIDCQESAAETAAALAAFFWQSSDDFLLWLGSRFSQRTHPFERSVIESEMGTLKEFSIKRDQPRAAGSQLALL